VKITKIDYVICVGSAIMFVYFFFFVGAIEHVGEYGGRTIEYSAVVIIAPIISIAWLVMILWGEEIPRLRDMDIKRHIQVKIRWIKTTLREQQKEWKNRHLHTHLHEKNK